MNVEISCVDLLGSIQLRMTSPYRKCWQIWNTGIVVKEKYVPLFLS